MSETRDRWLEAIDRHRLHPTSPGDERYWAPELETASRDELRAIQSDKLPLAVAYMAEHASMYADKLRDAGLEPGDIASIDDLHKLPVVTKDDMSASVDLTPPW